MTPISTNNPLQVAVEQGRMRYFPACRKNVISRFQRRAFSGPADEASSPDKKCRARKQINAVCSVILRTKLFMT